MSCHSYLLKQRNCMQVHGLTSASLAACVGPALTQQTTSTTSGHMGFDICAAIAFLIKNCREVFADASKHSHSNASSHSMHPATAEGTSSQGPDPTMPAHRASKASDRLPSMSNVAWEGRSAPITASQQPQERPQRPASSRGAANQPRKMDNLLTSIAWGPRKTYTAAADEGRCTAGTQQPQRGRSCRNRSRPHASQSPVRFYALLCGLHRCLYSLVRLAAVAGKCCDIIECCSAL